MKKMLIRILGLLIIFSSLSITFADQGMFNSTDFSANVNENGTNVKYDAICIEEGEYLTELNLTTNDEIVVRNGTIEYIVENWIPGMKNETNAYNQENIKFREGIWDITEDSSREEVRYPDLYEVKKILNSYKNITEEIINGTTYKVTTWAESGYNFLFRKTGDGPDFGQQDLLLYIVTPYDDEGVDYEAIPQEEPIEPNETIPPDNPILPPESPKYPTVPDDTNSINSPIGGNGAISPASATHSAIVSASAATNNIDSTMKETGIPIIAILLLLIASLSGIVIRKR